jgi:hypothetical protein
MFARRCDSNDVSAPLASGNGQVDRAYELLLFSMSNSPRQRLQRSFSEPPGFLGTRNSCRQYGQHSTSGSVPDAGAARA